MNTTCFSQTKSLTSTSTTKLNPVLISQNINVVTLLSSSASHKRICLSQKLPTIGHKSKSAQIHVYHLKEQTDTILLQTKGLM